MAKLISLVLAFSFLAFANPENSGGNSKAVLGGGGQAAKNVLSGGKARNPTTELGLRLEFVKAVEFSPKHDFKKTRVGGISGIIYEADTQTLWAVSDDRGKLAPPRIYKLKLESDLSLKFVDVIYVKDKESDRPVYDLESIALLPWGNFLLASEGDDRARPARAHRLFEVKTNGEYVRDYELPEAYKSGKGSQPKGLRTNFGFEAMGMARDGKSWLLGTESWLAQDSENVSHLLTYEMKEAWVLTPGTEYLYKPNFEVGLVNGLTDILNWKDDLWFFLERAAHFDGGEIKTHCQIVLAKVAGKDPIQGKPILDLPQVKSKNTSFNENYEAMSLGPRHEGSQILIVANDNNFSKAPTQFLFFKIKEESNP